MESVARRDWPLGRAAFTAICQHISGVCLTFSTGSPVSAILAHIGATWRRLRPWCRLRCRLLRRLWCRLRAGTAARSTIYQHVSGVCLTLSTGGPLSAILILVGAPWRRLRTWRRLQPWRRLWLWGRCCSWAELTVAKVFTIALALAAKSALAISSSASFIAAEPRALRRRRGGLRGRLRGRRGRW